jgi:hypothetical protein
VEHDDATGNYVSAPVIPVPLNSEFRVITVDEQKFDLIAPLFCSVEAEFLNPDDASIVAALKRSVRGALHGIDPAHATEVEGVYQPQSPARGHRLAQCHRRGALRNSDLDETEFSRCPSLQRSVFVYGVLAEIGTETEPREDRMTQ